MMKTHEKTYLLTRRHLTVAMLGFLGATIIIAGVLAWRSDVQRKKIAELDRRLEKKGVLLNVTSVIGGTPLGRIENDAFRWVSEVFAVPQVGTVAIIRDDGDPELMLSETELTAMRAASSLTLIGDGINDSLFASLMAGELESLELERTAVSARALSHLSRCERLTDLAVSDVVLIEEHVRSFAFLVRLNKLTVDIDACHAGLFVALPQLPQMEVLALRVRARDDCEPDLAWLAQCRELVILEIHGRVRESDIAAVSKACSKLEFIELAESELPVNAMYPLRQCTRLRKAFLDSVDVLDEIRGVQ